MPVANETHATSNVECEPDNEPESNFLLSGIGGTLRSGLSEPSNKEKQRRNYERKILENRFDAFMSTWLSFGAWSVDEACRLLAGIPIRPIARDSDLEDRAHLTRKSNYRRLLLVAGTYKKLADGATPAEWIDWFNTSGVAKQVSNAPRIAEPLSAPEKAAPPAVVAIPADWIESARTVALEYIARHQAQNLFPGQNDVCGYIETTLRTAKTYGPQGKPLSSSYIKRNAIQGIWWKANKP